MLNYQRVCFLGLRPQDLGLFTNPFFSICFAKSFDQPCSKTEDSSGMHQSTAACHCLTLRWGPFRLMFRLMALRLRQSIGTLTALQSASLAFPDDFRMNQLCPKTVIFGIFQWLFQWLITNHDESHCAAETALVLVLRNVLPSQLSHLSRRHRATGPMLAAPRTCFEPSKG